MTDLSRLSDADLDALERGDMAALSDEALSIISGEATTALQPQQPAPEASGYTAKDALAPWDYGLNLASGMLAGPASGIAGLGALAVPGVNAADMVKAVQEKMTYQPRTKLGGEIADVAGSILSIPARAGDTAGEVVTDVTGSPTLGTAANVATQMLPAAFGVRGAAALRNRAIAREAPVSVTNATLREAVDAGYRMPPSMMGRPTGLLEVLSGQEALMRDVQRHNAQVVNEAARRDANIPGTGQIAQAQIEGVAIPREQAAYGRMRLVSQNASDIVDGIMQLGSELRTLRRIDARNPTPETTAALQQASRNMDLYHQMLEAEANSRGVPQLAADMREARVALGRIGSVERALNESTGNVSARDLARQRELGVPIDTNPGMATAARMAGIDNGALVREPTLFNKSDRSAMRAISDAAGIPWALRRALLSRPVQELSRPANPRQPLTGPEQMRMFALIEALQNKENQQ